MKLKKRRFVRRAVISYIAWSWVSSALKVEAASRSSVPNVIRTPLPIGATEADALKQVRAMLLEVYPDIHLRVED